MQVTESPQADSAATRVFLQPTLDNSGRTSLQLGIHVPFAPTESLFFLLSVASSPG